MPQTQSGVTYFSQSEMQQKVKNASILDCVCCAAGHAQVNVGQTECRLYNQWGIPCYEKIGRDMIPDCIRNLFERVLVF
jgi:hypothetical protein